MSKTFPTKSLLNFTLLWVMAFHWPYASKDAVFLGEGGDQLKQPFCFSKEVPGAVHFVHRICEWDFRLNFVWSHIFCSINSLFDELKPGRVHEEKCSERAIKPTDMWEAQINNAFNASLAYWTQIAGHGKTNALSLLLSRTNWARAPANDPGLMRFPRLQPPRLCDNHVNSNRCFSRIRLVFPF